MSAFVETALGIILIFLFTSLVVTAIQEVVAALFSLRAKALEGALKALLDGSAGGTNAFDKFKKNPLIQSLYNVTGGRPSYIPARSFALAVLNMAKQTTGALDEVKIWAAGSNSGEIGGVVNSLLTDATADVTALQKSIETWYDETMDRLTGWYKRWTQVMTIVFGLVAAVAFNIDTIKVWDALSSQHQLREAAAAYAGILAKAEKPPADYNVVLKEFDKMKLPIGWKDASGKNRVDWSWLSIIGWIITALAASLGSAFWFDLLKRFVHIRAAGPKPSVAEPQVEPGATAPGGPLLVMATKPRAAFLRDRA